LFLSGEGIRWAALMSDISILARTLLVAVHEKAYG
jgi:hypothetical protein